MTLPYAHPTLRREVGLFGAVMLGLGSILGTGVFVALPLKTAEAGLWIIPAIVVAGLVALCNALSSAQLASAHPVAGGTYEYGYRFLKPWLGFTAGWTFLLAKSASAATAALGVLIYTSPHRLSPDSPDAGIVAAARIGMAVFFVALLAAATLTGIRRTSTLNTILVIFTCTGLLAFCASAATVTWSAPLSALPSTSIFDERQPQARLPEWCAWAFVAFTGYGRLATLGEEVREPKRTIPRAILATLSATIVIYIAVALCFHYVNFPVAGRTPSLVSAFTGHEQMASIGADIGPIWPRVWPLVFVAAVTAMLGVLLNLILGLSRVWLAMARRGDAPAILARIHEPTSTPRPAVILTGVVIAALVLVGDVRLTWSFSAFTVLIYYAITNWAALKLPAEHRLYPRWIAWCGLIACASLAWFVEWQVWATGVAIIAIGLAWHAWRRRTAPALTT